MTAEYWRYVASGLKVWRYYRLQAVLSFLGVVAGLCGLVLVLALGEGARREMNQALGLLGAGTMLVRSPPAMPMAERISPERAGALGRLLDVRLQQQVPVVIRQQTLNFPGLRRNDVRVIGTTADYASTYRLRIHSGRFLSRYDVERGQAVCVLGWDLGRAVLRQGGKLGQRLQLGDRHCLLVGLLKPASQSTGGFAELKLPDFDQAAYLPVTVLGTGAQAVRLDELVLRFRTEGDVLEAGAAVQRILEYGRDLPVLEYVIPAEMLRQKFRMQSVMRYLLAGVTVIMLGVGGVGIMNMMMVNVLRRRPEIGLRRAVGATRRDIIVQFIVESALVAGGGGLAGIVLGVAAAFLLGSLLAWSVAVPWWSLPLGLLLSLALGALFGGYPALQAASVEPIRSLNQG